MAWQIMRVEERWILRDFRDKLGLTQQQIANKAKIQLRQYQRFENGERDLSSSSFGIACRVIEALGMNISDYYHGKYVLGEEVELSMEGLKKKKNKAKINNSGSKVLFHPATTKS